MYVSEKELDWIIKAISNVRLCSNKKNLRKHTIANRLSKILVQLNTIKRKNNNSLIN